MNSIDQRIVSMKFDNAQFEAGAKESLKTLDELKSSMDLEKSADKVKGFSVAPLLDGINGLKAGFSALDIVAITAISNITTALMEKLGSAFDKTIGQIYSGGLRRAQNLEQARFSMQGLLYDTEAAGDAVWRYGFTVEDVMKAGGPVQNAVKDTAFGLDEAAKAASNFIASGVTDLEYLEKVLSSISGTAAQTGSSYEDIAHIYARIAGNNRVYAIDLQSFAARGVNAAAAIRDELNRVAGASIYTEAAVRDMVSEGEIDLELFSRAMYNAFGENAFRANETYSGSLANLNAALSRLGAKFESKKLENMRDIFNALRPTVDALSAALDPLINVVVGLNTSFAQFAIGKIGQFESFLKSLTEAPKGSFEARQILENFDAYTEGMNKIQKLEYKKELEAQLFSPVERIGATISNLFNSIKNIGSTIKTFFSPIIDAFKNITGAITPFTQLIQKVSESFLGFTENLKESASGILESVINFTETNKFFKLLESGVSLVSTAIKIFVKNAKSFIDMAVTAFGPIFTATLGKLLKALEPVAEGLTSFFNLISEFITNNIDFSKFTNSVSNAFTKMGDDLSPIGEKLTAVKDKIVNFFKSIVETIREVFPDLTLQKVFGWLLDFKIGDVLGTLTGITNPIGTAIAGIGELLSGDKIEKSFNSIANAATNTGNRLNLIKPAFGNAKFSLTAFKDAVVDTAKGVEVSEEKFAILNTISAFVEQLADILSRLWTKITNAFSRIGESISGFFSKFTLSNVSAGVVAIGTGGLMYQLIRFADSFRKIPVDLAKSVEDLIQAIVGAFEGLQEAFAGIKTAAIINTVKSFGIAILLTAIAFKLLSTIDWEKDGMTAVKSISVVVGELLVAFTAMALLISKFGDAKNLRGLAPKLIGFSVAVLILAASMKVLGSLDADQIKNGTDALTHITVLIMAYAAVMSAVNSLGGNTKGAALISMGVSMVLMAQAIKMLGSIDPKVLSQGLSTIEELLVFISLYNYIAAQAKGKSSGAGLILMATSLMIFAGAIQLLGLLKPEAVMQGMGVIFSVLTMMGVYLQAIEKTKPISAAAGLLIMSVALITMAAAIQLISNMALDANAVAPIATMIGTLLAIAVALRIVGSNGSIKSAAAILIVSAAMIALANALLILSIIPFASLVTNLLVIIVGLGALGMMSTLISKAALALTLTSKAFALFGAGLLAVAVSITLLTPVLMMFTVAMLGSLTLMIQGIIEMKDKIAEGLAAIIEIILTAFRSSIDLLVGLIVELVGALFTALTEMIEPIVSFAQTLFVALVDALVELIPYLVDSILQIITALLQSLADNMAKIVELGMQIVIEFMNGISSKLPELVDSAITLIVTFINSIADGIRDHAEEVGEAGWNLITALIEGIVGALKGLLKNPLKWIKEMGQKLLSKLGEFLNDKEGVSKIGSFIGGLISGIPKKLFQLLGKIGELGKKLIDKLLEFISFDKLVEIGKDLVNGLIDGVANLAGSAVDAVKGLGESMWNGLKDFLGINSPSTLFREIGVNTVEGLNNGINSKKKDSETSMLSVGSTILNAINGLFGKKEGENIGSSFTSNLSNGIKNGMATAKATATNLLGGIKSSLNKDKEFEEIGKNLMSGLTVGIKKGTPKVVEQAGSTALSVIKRVRNENEVKSPSRVFMRIGEYCMEGFAIGLSETRAVESSLDKLRDTVNDAINSDFVDYGGPVITPVLDLSEIQNGASDINGMFGNSSIGNVAANVQLSISNSITSAFDRLSALISGMPEDLIDTNKVYEAVRDGASNAVFNVILDGERITNVVSNVMNSQMQRDISFLGG